MTEVEILKLNKQQLHIQPVIHELLKFHRNFG